MRSVHAVAVSAFTLAALAVCCGWPYEVGTAPVSDADPGETGGDDAVADAAGYDVPVAFCNDGALKSGEALLCACGDAALDETGDGGGPFGHQACNLEGSIGPCIGCPETTSCDGVTSPPAMICVPGGVTALGAKNASVCPPEGCAVEGPVHNVAVSRFFLDEREVTVKRFRDWWTNGHVAPLPGDVIYTAGDGTVVTWQEGWAVTEPTAAADGNNATWGPLANDPLPINYVDWPTALAFCAASKSRLPTEAEWEAAASGHEGRLFPREAKESRNAAPSPAMLPCVRALSGAGGADCGPLAPPVGTSERFSRDGVYDLAGSVAEWVLDVEPPGGAGCTTNCYPSAPSVDPLLFVSSVLAHGVRGGAWNDVEPKLLRTQARDFKIATTKSAAIGFRCAKR